MTGQLTEGLGFWDEECSNIFSISNCKELVLAAKEEKKESLSTKCIERKTSMM